MSKFIWLLIGGWIGAFIFAITTGAAYLGKERRAEKRKFDFEKFAAEMCDNYCKKLDIQCDESEMDEICSKCPLCRLEEFLEREGMKK